MLLRHYRLTEEMVAFLDSLPGNKTEHVRRALEDYKEKLDKQKVSSSLSDRQNG